MSRVERSDIDAERNFVDSFQQKRVEVKGLVTVDAQYLSVTLLALSGLQKLFFKNIMKVEAIAAKLSYRCIFRADLVETQGVQAASQTLVTPCPGDILISAAKYFKPSFQTE